MTVPTGIPTSVGLAQVLHRAALAVECVDAVTDQLARNPVRVGRETAGPLVDLDATAAGRFVLRHRPSLPNTVTVRLTDPDRRFVPRRLRVPLWTLAEVELAEAKPPGAYVPVRSRLVRAWLSPGSAYDRPGGATAIRGRVTMAGAPVRWPRVTALDGALPVGWAHGDERGEFLLVVADSRAEFPATMEVDLLVRARDPAQVVAPDPADPLADLTVEELARSSAPPTGGDLDNRLLRGRTAPPGYVASAGIPPHLTLDVGVLRPDVVTIDFTV